MKKEIKIIEREVWNKIHQSIDGVASLALTNYRPCPVCSKVDSNVVFELSDFQFYTDSAEYPKRVDVRVHMCRGCHALYQNPCCSEYGFSVLYSEAGCSYGSKEGRPGEQIDWLQQRNLLKNGMIAMDAGCYQGDFLGLMPNNIKKIGVDIDAPAIELGRRIYGQEKIEFIHGEFESFVYRGEPPDLITMFHVLEHLPRPVAVLKKLHQLSHSETRLIIEVPILENGITNDINGFFSVHHLTHFSRGSLENCFIKAGWRIVEWTEGRDYNGCRVVVAPERGITGEVKGFAQDIGLVNAYLKGWHSSVLEVENKINVIPNSESIVIWGAGSHLEFLYQRTSLFSSGAGHKFRLVDADSLKVGRKWRGISIENIDAIVAVNWSNTRLLISSYGNQPEIERNAVAAGVPAQQIIKLYDYVNVC